MMKGLFILYLSLVRLVATAQCYGRRGIDPLGQLKAHRYKKSSVKTISENLSSPEYSLVYIGPQHGLKEANKVLKLPGQPSEVNVAQYSGYVTVDHVAGGALFYYFVESENSSAKPLVLWFNGEMAGPGCSSLGRGAMMELGPFRVNSNGRTLSQNANAWNNLANILSLERFPEYKTRNFFVAGESYACHFVPQLAYLMLKYNKISNQTIINLRGIAIGNPLIDDETAASGTADFLWHRSVISDQIHEGIVLNRNLTSKEDWTPSGACLDCVNLALDNIQNLNISNIYDAVCNSSSSSPSVGYIRLDCNSSIVQLLHDTRIGTCEKQCSFCRITLN